MARSVLEDLLLQDEGIDLQQFIQQQLAGDVVPLRPEGSQQRRDILEKLMQPGVLPGAMGQQSIERYGGKQSPYLDLMDILMMQRRR